MSRKTTIRFGDRRHKLVVVPAAPDVRTAKARARYAYLWIGPEEGPLYGYISGARTLRKLAKAILAEVGDAK